MPTHEGRHSIFAVDEQRDFEFDYYMDNINVISDVSFGQRNYQRNLDVMLDDLFRKRAAITSGEKSIQ